MPKKKYEFIASKIFNDGNIVARCATSKEDALLIMEEGFEYDDFSYFMQSEDDILDLCNNYNKNDSFESIIVIMLSTKLLRDLLGDDSEAHRRWIKRIRKNRSEVMVFHSITCFDGEKGYIPRELILGRIDSEKALLERNIYFYDNLPKEEQAKFISQIRENLFGEQVRPYQKKRYTEKLIS